MTPSRIWPLIAGKYAPEDVLSRWEVRLGDEFPRARPLLTETGDTTETWASGREREGCARLVQRYDDGLAAACGAPFDRCGRVTLEPRGLVLWRLDERRVFGALRRAMRLDGDGRVPDRLVPAAVPLGQRVVSGVPIRFYATRQADAALCAEVFAADARGAECLPDLLACRAPAAGALPATRVGLRGLPLRREHPRGHPRCAAAAGRARRVGDGSVSKGLFDGVGWVGAIAFWTECAGAGLSGAAPHADGAGVVGLAEGEDGATVAGGQGGGWSVSKRQPTFYGTKLR